MWFQFSCVYLHNFYVNMNITRQIFGSNRRPVESTTRLVEPFYWTSSRPIFLLLTSEAAESHALAHTFYWTSSRGYFSTTRRPVEIDSTGRPVECFYWMSS